MSDKFTNGSGGTDLLTATFTGEHTTDVDDMFEDSETVEWEFDERALFQTVAFRIYQSDEAGVREPLLNAISSALRSQRLHGVDPKVGVYLYAGDGDTPMTLVIRDNGVGITEDTLRNSLAYVGKSQNRWVADLVGKFGIGFLASFRLVSETGMFFMHTHARDTDDEFRGRWSSRGFEIDRGDDLPDVFADDEYGTRLEFPIKDDITRQQIRNWVRKHAQNARVPVDYREEGFPEYNHTEQYGGKTLPETYDDTSALMTIEEDSFVAYCSPEADGKVLCLDSPVSGGSTRHYGRRSDRAPFPIDVRLLSENGPVIEGPHEGLTPVSESELREIPSEFHDQFMLKSDLTEADVRLPHPTGSRETLSDHAEEFIAHLHERFSDMYEAQMAAVLDKVDSPDDVYESLSADERFLLLDLLDTIQYGHAESSVETIIDNRYNVQLDAETASTLDMLITTVDVVQRGDDAISELDRRRYKIYELVEEMSDDGTVFIGASLHPTKAQIAWAANDANRVVELPSNSEHGSVTSVAEMYDILGNAFGWQPLKDISSATVDEYDVSDDLKDALCNGVRATDSGVEGRELTLHIDNKEYKWKVTVGDLAEYLQDYHDDDTNLDDETVQLSWEYDKPTRVILFPSTGDANVSDHYDLSTKTTAVAYCTKKAAKHLDTVPGVVRYTELENVAREQTLPTSDGECPVDGTPHRPIVHILPDDQYDVFATDEVMAAAAEYIPLLHRDEFRPDDWDGYYDERPDDTVVDATYIPMTADQFERVHPALPDDAYIVFERSTHLPTRDNTDGIRTVNNTKIYAHAMLPEWRDSEKFTNIMRDPPRFAHGGRDLVDALAESHNNGFTLDATTEGETDTDTDATN